MTRISALPEETAPTSTDSIPMLDVETMTTKRTTIAKLQPMDNPYKFAAYLNANANLTDATFTKVAFDVERFDSNNNFDITTNKGRYTAPVAGFYQFNAYAVLTAPNTGVAGIIALYKNGSEIYRGDMGAPSTANSAAVFGGTISELVQLAANDYVEVYVYLDVTSGTPAVAGTTKNTRFSGFLVSRT